MQPVTISIITPVFNCQSGIEKTIRSVTSQDGVELEYIIIDGGSTDGTVDIIRSCAAQDSRIRWTSEPDQGISDAFNKGIRQATGELIGIINADDELLPGALRSVVDAFHTHPDSDVFHGNMLRMAGETTLFTLKPLPVEQNIWRQMPLNHPATFVTRRAYEVIGLFDVHLRVAMDYDLMLRLYRAGCRFFYIDATLAAMRYGGASDDRFLAGLREARGVSIRHGCPAWRAGWWFCWKAVKGYLKLALRATGLQGVLKLHPRFR